MVAAWRKSLSVDGAVVRQTQAHGLSARFVPTVILPNREDIALSSFIPWSERQLVAAKSSGSGWAVVQLHAVSLATCVFGPVIMLAIGCTLDRTALVIGLFAAVFYWSGTVLSTIAIEAGMRRVLMHNQVAHSWMNVSSWIMFLPALVLSHLVYFRTLIGAHFRKSVKWRGVEYKIAGVNDVQMVSYQPYQGGLGGDIQSVV
jgi:hypothetical protein